MNSNRITNVVFSILIGVLVVFATQAILRWMLPNVFKQIDSTSVDSTKRGVEFAAPTPEEMLKPLNTTVFKAPASLDDQRTPVTTSYATFNFSTMGGSIKEMTYQRTDNKSTLTPLKSTEPATSGFLVSFDNQTPYRYTLVSKKEHDTYTELVYKSVAGADGSAPVVTKRYAVYKEMPRIDLRLTIDAKDEVRPRILVPAPYIAEADKGYEPHGLVFTDKEKLQKKPMRQILNNFWRVPSLFGVEDRYFVTALVADGEGFARRAYYADELTLVGIDAEDKVGEASGLVAIIEGPTINGSKTWDLSFYVGPKDAHLMEAVDPRLEAALDYGWLSPLVKILLTILKFLNGIVHNYGWAILLLTLLIRLLMAPLTWRTREAAGKQKEYQRKMQYIEQRYKDEPGRLNEERLELTKKYGMSSMAGCLPQLVQLPILFGLNRLLYSSIELYQAPFMWWITDLSAKDPYYILPLLSGLGLLVQLSEDVDMKRGVGMFVFAAFLVAFTANFPAGLTLYLAANTWLSMAQVYFQKKLSHR